MAGILPGVECARRRRFHQSGACLDSPSLVSTRRSSFCLYPRNRESRFPSFSSTRRSMFYQTRPDEKMDGATREAKHRLDDKFRAQRMSKNQRQNNIKCVEGRRTSIAELHTEVYGSKKSGSKKFSWSKWSWKASKQGDCAVCLESFKVAETLIHLPCAHRFHNICLKPWSQIRSLTKRYVSHYFFRNFESV